MEKNIIAPSFTIYPLKQTLYLFYGGPATGKSQVSRDSFSNRNRYENPKHSDWHDIISLSEHCDGVIIIFNDKHLLEQFLTFYHNVYKHKEMWYEKYQNYYIGK